MYVSKLVNDLPPSGIRAFFDLVMGMKDVVSLGVGEPDFVTPWHIREKAIYSLEQGCTSYTSNKGMPELRKEICAFLKSRFGLEYHWDNEMLVTVGASEALDLVCRAILEPGEKVIIHEPCFVAYAPLVKLAGGVPVPLITTAQEGFKVTPDKLERAWSKGTKAFLINYPCNPTGTSYTRAELAALAKVAQKKDMLVLSDEIYDELTYDFDHTPFSALPGMRERVVYLNGFSKAYAMTGWRLGWAAGNEKILAAMTKIHQYLVMCASITSQMAGREAIKNGRPDVLLMKKEYNRRRNYIVASLNELGLECHMPQGAFYAFPSIKSLNMSSIDFARDLLEKQKVALVPGGAFGSQCADHVRISYASSYDNLREAVSRITQYLKARNGGKEQQ
ncbi:MAG: aminotransferase class I/II-fold pyridoxal phosphate-dependent enzyme [Candidatus Omnitrophica bacterium]|nr:aminotransferase class I/II-fold pyridoxal phosphate-dependent enzyme [Candidatus Omnitrophota bacterium]